MVRDSRVVGRLFPPFGNEVRLDRLSKGSGRRLAGLARGAPVDLPGG